MDQEMDFISRNKTWALVYLATAKNSISAKWVYKTKVGAAGKQKDWKLDWWQEASNKKSELINTETFAPVVKSITVRTIVAIATKRRWSIRHVHGAATRVH